MKIKINQIIPDSNQPRKTFSEEAINELQSSFGNLGLIQPITVRPIDNGRYMIIVGERRFTASKQRGDVEIECIVREDIDDKTVREMQFAENTQQEDIPDEELGQGFLSYCEKYKCTMAELARRINKDRRFIEDRIAIVTNLNPCLHNEGAKPLNFTEKREIQTLPDFKRQEEVAEPFIKGLIHSSKAQEVVRLAKEQPSRSVPSIIAQVQYNIETEKANHRELLNEYKRQQIDPQPSPKGKYKAIIVDPPWSIEKILRDVRPNQFDIDYPTMTTEEIMQLPITELADENGCHIYLWTTHKYLPIAFDVLESWGANYQCLLTWVKNVGMTPFSFMYSTEHCLFARIGNLPLLKMGERLDFQAKVREHSRKPKEFYDLVREVSPKPRIDMFGREKHDGFEVWGNEPEKFKSSIVAEIK